MTTTYTETTGTLTNTTVAVAANENRRELIISNNSDTAMTYRPSGTASAAAGIAIAAGTALRFLDGAAPTTAGTVFCAGTSKAYSIYER